MDAWEQQTNRLKQSFFKDATWERVVAIWKTAFRSSRVEPNSLFRPLKIRVQDVTRATREAEHETGSWMQASLSWVPINRVFDFHVRLQDRIDSYGGLPYDISYYSVNRPTEITTLYNLWQARHSIEQICAVLIQASLRSREHRQPDNWPDGRVIHAMEMWAYNPVKEFFTWWHHMPHEVLPFITNDYRYEDYDLDNVESFVRYLSDEHVRLLLECTPVVVEYGEEGDQAERAAEADRPVPEEGRLLVGCSTQTDD